MRHYLDGVDWQLVGWYRNQWRFSRSMELGEMLAPAVAPRSATVPGAIQADLLRHGVIPDPREGIRSREIEWTNNREWFLEKRFRLPDGFLAEGRRTILVCEGLDPVGEIHCNGEVVGHFTSMMTPYQVDLSDVIRDGENFLRIVFYQTPEIDGQFGYTDRIPLIRSRFNYVWDWCPRIIPTGVWQSVYLESYVGARIVSLAVTGDHEVLSASSQPDSHAITVELAADVEAPGTYIASFALSDSAGAELDAWSEPVDLSATSARVTVRRTVAGLKRWWPRGMGEQPLYTLTVALARGADYKKGCARTIRFGMRSVALQQNPGSPEGALPYTLAVNGRALFMKGVNWVPLSPWMGTVTRDDYRAALARFVEMECNLLRVWGGATLERREFFELCDELGLLVWHEFPQSSSGINNLPNSDPDYLAEMERVARSYIQRARSHPSLAIWCGGNELMDDNYRPVDTDHPTIGMLAAIVREESPGTPFLPASPSGPRFVALLDSVGEGVHHDVHGPWKYEGPAAHYALFNGEDSLLRTETGTPGHSRMETLARWADGHSVWPPDDTNPYWTHRGAWWIDRGPIEALAGPFAEHEFSRFLALQRYLQAEALRYAAEATRRRAPRASGFLVWMGNEPFPNNSNTSVIEADLTPKPAHAVLARSFAPVALTARYDAVALRTGDAFSARIVAVWDGASPKATPMPCSWRLIDPAGVTVASGDAEIQPTRSPAALPVGSVSATVASVGVYVLLTEIAKQRMAYLFSVTEEGEPPLAALGNAPPATFTTTLLPKADGRADGSSAGATARLRIAAGEETVLGLFVYGADAEARLSAVPNMVSLLPGEERTVQLSAPGVEEITQESLRFDWINRSGE